MCTVFQILHLVCRHRYQKICKNNHGFILSLFYIVDCEGNTTAISAPFVSIWIDPVPMVAVHPSLTSPWTYIIRKGCFHRLEHGSSVQNTGVIVSPCHNFYDLLTCLISLRWQLKLLHMCFRDTTSPGHQVIKLHIPSIRKVW